MPLRRRVVRVADGRAVSGRTAVCVQDCGDAGFRFAATRFFDALGRQFATGVLETEPIAKFGNRLRSGPRGSSRSAWTPASANRRPTSVTIAPGAQYFLPFNRQLRPRFSGVFQSIALLANGPAVSVLAIRRRRRIA